MKNFAYGHAFNAVQLLETFNLSKLKFNSETCIRLTGHANRKILVRDIFKYTVFKVIDDVINESINFKCPGTNFATYLYMKRVTGNVFKKARQNGKWGEVDLWGSNFSSAMLVYETQRKGHRKAKPIYVDVKRRDAIIEKVNSGFVYTNIYEREIDYYIPYISERFPGIEEKDFKYILSSCFKLLYLHTVYGADVTLKVLTPDSFAYFGHALHDPLDHFNYYCHKLAKKLAYTIKKKKIPHGEYFYFALRDKQYDEYTQTKLEHPRQKIFTFNNLLIFAFQDICHVKKRTCRHFFRVKYTYDNNTRFFESVKFKDFEYLYSQEPSKFADISVENHKYEHL